MAVNRPFKAIKNEQLNTMKVTVIEGDTLSSVQQFIKQYLTCVSCPYSLTLAREHGGNRYQLLDTYRTHGSTAAETGILRTFFINDADVLELMQIIANTTVILKDVGGYRTPNMDFEVTEATYEALQAYEIVLSRRKIIDEFLVDLPEGVSDTNIAVTQGK